ncbi:MAG: hypothetical protein ABIJ21_03840 [Nanoarchaeota archaeon]
MYKEKQAGWGILALLMVLALSAWASALPSGVDFIYNQTLNYTPQSAAELTTAGGSFTTMSLNITAQSLRWKAYVGNVTGIMTLNDAVNNTIYDWTPSIVTGEIFASRAGTLNWALTECADAADMSGEMTAINMNADSADSLNNTFNASFHKAFYVGTVSIPQNDCFAIATYVNDTRQAAGPTALFQEILLTDTSSLFYATIIENNKYGFNNQLYDFQLILANDEFASSPTTYYFFAEIG